MAQSVCSACKGADFEAVKADIAPRFIGPFYFVQCVKCGAVIGVIDPPERYAKITQALEVVLKPK